MHVLTVGIFSIPELSPIILRIWAQSDLSKSLVVDDWILVPRNRIITLTLLLSIHSRKRYDTFAITDVFPAPGSPHITTGDLKHAMQYFKWIYLFTITQTLIRALGNSLAAAQNVSRFNFTMVVRGIYCVHIYDIIYVLSVALLALCNGRFLHHWPKYGALILSE